jgi:hypothetical protein
LNRILNPEKQKMAFEEAKMEYLLLKNPLKNVINSYGSYYDQTSNKFMFSMDYYAENLREYIERNKQIDFPQFISIFKDIITGIKKYHNFYLTIYFPKAFMSFLTKPK